MSSSEDKKTSWPEEDKKTSWPEVVGKTIEEAKTIILKDKPDAEIVVNGRPTDDLRFNRVRIFGDTVVLQIPRVG